MEKRDGVVCVWMDSKGSDKSFKKENGMTEAKLVCFAFFEV